MRRSPVGSATEAELPVIIDGPGSVGAGSLGAGLLVIGLVWVVGFLVDFRCWFC